MNDERARVIDAQRGSDEAFTGLVEAYQGHVYNLCFRMLGDVEAAQDAAQETFLRAFQHLHRYDLQRPFGTWLLSIAAHYCIDRLRRRRYRVDSLEEEEEVSGQEFVDADAPNPEQESARREQRDQMQQVLKHLDSVDRAAVVLRYWHEYSESEIGQALGLTVSAVKSRLHRARRELAELWRAEAHLSAARRSPHESPAF